MKKLKDNEPVLMRADNPLISFVLIIAMCLMGFCMDLDGASRPRNRGLLMTVESPDGSKSKALSVLPGPHIYIPKGSSPHPSMKPGPFKATISGILRVPIRADYYFSLIGSKSAQFTFNEESLLKVESDGEAETTSMMQLNKGYFDFQITLQGDSSKNDTFFRLTWGDAETPLAPFAYRTIGFNASSELRSTVKQQELVNEGKKQFEQLRCFKCHSDNTGEYVNFNDNLDAPELEGIGSRRNASWFVAWLKDPTSIRPNARMPKIFHGETQDSEIKAVASYLSSLKVDPFSEPKISEVVGDAQAGGQLFDKLLCSACHEKPGGDNIHIDPDNERFDLNHVNAKYTQGALKEFLLKPSQHYKSIRMPDFRLSDSDASNLVTFLRSNEMSLSFPEFSPSDDLIAEGKNLVSQLGCISCHKGPIDNKLESPKFTDLMKLTSHESKCLDPESPSDVSTIHYDIDEDQKGAITAFLKSDFAYYGGDSPYAQIDMEMTNLQCAHCHGTYEGFPSLALMNGKLNPSWAAKFISGKAGYHTRPWLEARMPGFEFYADDLSKGMAVANGFSPDGPKNPPVDPEKAEIGKNLVSAGGGFACVTCHDVGDFKATAVFEAPGINLAYSGERLQEEFFVRWLLHPLKVDRSSKMPVYFDKGKSPLDKYYEGDANKQVDAIWHYVLMGKDMPPPVVESTTTDSVADEFE